MSPEGLCRLRKTKTGVDSCEPAAVDEETLEKRVLKLSLLHIMKYMKTY